jgi:hypothetical protein
MCPNSTGREARCLIDLVGNKAEIGWKRVNDDGIKITIFARQVGRDWKFFARERRFDQWQPIQEPPLEDWLELLEAVRRRVVRRLYQPDDEQRLRGQIRARFPEWLEAQQE